VGRSAQDVHIGDIVGYKRTLADRDLAPATIAKKLSALRSFFRVCHAQGLRPTNNPTAGVTLPRVKDETGREILSLAKVEELVNTIDKCLSLSLPVLYSMKCNHARDREALDTSHQPLPKAFSSNHLISKKPRAVFSVGELL
jgi:hypothetical protein